jgi:acetyl esterase/lipase
LAANALHAQNSDFITLTYHSGDSIDLELDLFLPDAGDKPAPLLIYVHGGGFSNGNRTAGHNLARFLRKNHIAVASITYTLYMKDKSFSCEGVLAEKIKAIQIAANQLWLASGFLIDKSAKYNIDTDKIFIAGSSAGAETVLHAAFWNREDMMIYNKTLPAGFLYAGVISGAGAIMDLNLIKESNLTPVLMFHGNSDVLVPYGTAAHHYCKPDAPGWLMFFGSHSIFEHLSNLNGSVSLITYCGGGHKYAGAHFYQDQQPVLDFIKDVLAGEDFRQHTIIATGESDERSRQYDFCR